MRFARCGDIGSEHARALWGSIVRAKGFHTDFSDWWTTCQWRTLGAPLHLPFVPPDCQIAERVFDTVVLAFREFEQQLHRSSRLYARQRRAQNPNMIFRDIQDQRDVGVEVLTRVATAEIAEVIPAEISIVFTEPINFDVTEPILCQGKALPVIYHEADCVWLEHIDGIMYVLQTSYLGSNEELFTAFSDEWKYIGSMFPDFALIGRPSTPSFWNMPLPARRARLLLA